eukprot:ANDGO_04738.mRNA.1 hypothetical protein
MIANLPILIIHHILRFLLFKDILSIRLSSKSHHDAIVSSLETGALIYFPDEAWPLQVVEFLEKFPSTMACFDSARIASEAERRVHRQFKSRLFFQSQFVLPSVAGVYSGNSRETRTLLPHDPIDFMGEDLENAEIPFDDYYGNLCIAQEVCVGDLEDIVQRFPKWDLAVRFLNIDFSESHELRIPNARWMRCEDVRIDLESPDCSFGAVLPISNRVVCVPSEHSTVCAWKWFLSVSHRFLGAKELTVVVYQSRLDPVLLESISRMPSIPSLQYWEIVWVPKEHNSVSVRFSQADAVVTVTIDRNSLWRSDGLSPVKLFPLQFLNPLFTELVVIIALPQTWHQPLLLPGSTVIQSLTIYQKSNCTCPSLQFGEFPNLLHFNMIGPVPGEWMSLFPAASKRISRE